MDLAHGLIYKAIKIIFLVKIDYAPHEGINLGTLFRARSLVKWSRLFKLLFSCSLLMRIQRGNQCLFDPE